MLRDRFFKIQQIMVLLVVGSTLVLSACDTKSSVDFLGKRSEFKSVLSPTTSLSMGQGGVVNGQTVGGYKVHATLGSATGRVTGVTNSGHKVQMGFVGMSSNR